MGARVNNHDVLSLQEGPHGDSRHFKSVIARSIPRSTHPLLQDRRARREKVGKSRKIQEKKPLTRPSLQDGARRPGGPVGRDWPWCSAHGWPDRSASSRGGGHARPPGRGSGSRGSRGRCGAWFFASAFDARVGRPGPHKRWVPRTCGRTRKDRLQAAHRCMVDIAVPSPEAPESPSRGCREPARGQCAMLKLKGDPRDDSGLGSAVTSRSRLWGGFVRVSRGGFVRVSAKATDARPFFLDHSFQFWTLLGN